MKKQVCRFSEGSKIRQFVLAALINLPVLGYGAAIGWMSPMTLLLQSEQSPTGVPLSDSVISWMASAAYLTCIPSDFLFAYIGDKYGRKPALMVLSVSLAAAWILKLSSMSAWAFISARALIGVAMAGSFITCPMYTKEISDDSVRGTLGSFVILGQTAGNLLLYILGDLLSYNTILWVCLAIPVIHILLFLVMPESPSYLLKKGNHDEAAKVIAWLRCRNISDLLVTLEVESMKKEQQLDAESSKFAIKAIFKNKILVRAFKIALALTLAREVCGANPVLNFAGSIFAMASEGTGLILSPNQQAMMLGTVQVAGAILASSVVEKAGRKPLLFISSLVSGLSMCGLASWFLCRATGIYAPDWLPITSLCLCIFCDASGLQPISVVVMNEIFSFKYRATVSAITMATAAFSDFLQLLFFMPVASSIGIHVAFFFFGAVCLLNAAYVIVAVPETKQRSVEEIYEHLKTKKEKRKELEMNNVKDST